MELGISMFGDIQYNLQTGKKLPSQQRYQEMLEQVKLADQVGLDYFGMGEHHREDYAVTSPQMFLAAAASITKNIKLGSAVSVISSSDAVRLYEDFATLDNLSNGRAELMAGRGSFIESFPLFGYNLDDYDNLFEDKLMLLLELNKTIHSKISWNGRYTQNLVDQEIFPKPVQKQLPIWVAVGGTTSSVRRAAKLGLPITFAIIGGLPSNFKPLIDFYKTEYLSAGHPADKMQIGIHSHLFAGESSKIREIYYPHYAAQMDRIGKSRGWAPFTKQVFENTSRPEGAYFFGDANEITDKILMQHEYFGHTRFTGHVDVGAPSHDLIMKSIEIFGDKVAPAVRKSLNK